MLYVIIGHDAPRRREGPQVRPAHLAPPGPLARAGRIRLAGPLLDRTGSLIVLEATRSPRSGRWFARDPYVTEASQPRRGEAVPAGAAIGEVCHRAAACY